MSNEIPERFARLESHLTHLEHLVEELNGVVIEQGKVIERLRRQVQLHARSLVSAEMNRAKATNPRPPHH